MKLILTDKKNRCWYLSLILVITEVSFQLCPHQSMVHLHEESVSYHDVLLLFSACSTLVGMMIAKDFHIFQVETHQVT